MKKLSILILGLLIITGFTFAQSITVTSPNGGETLTRGNTFSISWTSSGVTGNVNLILWKGSANLGQIAQNKPANGSYSWPVGDDLVNPPGTPYPDGNDYKVMVKSIEDWTISDESNENFTISTPGPAASITVTSPNGGETLTRGNNFSIAWTSSGVSGNVNLILWKESSNLGQIAQNKPANGSYSWPVGDDLANPPGTTYPDGTDFKVMVKSIDDWTINDESNGNFNIVPEQSPASIKIDSPTSMWSFNAGGGMTVKWHTSGITGNVKITLHKDNNTLVFLVKESHPYNGSPHKFTIPDNLETGKYYIKISQGNNSRQSGNFTINKKTSSIQISQPIPNISYLKGKLCVIKWFSTNISDNYVNIRLHFGRNFNNVLPVVNGAANKDGNNQYSWNIPGHIQDGDYKIYIVDSSKQNFGLSKKFKIIGSRKCDLALIDAEYCNEKIVFTIKNIGDHYNGKISLILIMPNLKPAPFFKKLPERDLILFTDKSLKLTYKNPYYSEFKYNANFMLTLNTDEDHADQNKRNNLFNGIVYKGCGKPDLDVKVLHSGHKGPYKIGNKMKLLCEIYNNGGKIKGSWVLRLEINNHDKVLIHSKEWVFSDISMVKKIEYKYKIKGNVTRGGYNFANWCADYYNSIDEENERNHCATLGFMVK